MKNINLPSLALAGILSATAFSAFAGDKALDYAAQSSSDLGADVTANVDYASQIDQTDGSANLIIEESEHYVDEAQEAGQSAAQSVAELADEAEQVDAQAAAEADLQTDADSDGADFDIAAETAAESEADVDLADEEDEQTDE